MILLHPGSRYLEPSYKYVMENCDAFWSEPGGSKGPLHGSEGSGFSGGKKKRPTAWKQPGLAQEKVETSISTPFVKTY